MPQVRQSAGLLLKNNLKNQYASLSEDFRNYIKVMRDWGLGFRIKAKPYMSTTASEELEGVGGSQGKGRGARWTPRLVRC